MREAKQQIDSIQTITTLMAMGVEQDRFKVIFNLAEKDTPINKQYSVFLADDVCKEIVGENPVVVYHNNIFNILNKSGLQYRSEERRVGKECKA